MIRGLAEVVRFLVGGPSPRGPPPFERVEANHRMAKALKVKGYEYQYLFCRNAGHSIGNAQQ